LFPGLAAQKVPVAQLTSAGCPPVLDYSVASAPACSQTNEFVMQHLRTGKYDVTVIAANWRKHFSDRDFQRQLKKAISGSAKA
jgi:hypothetical protein